MMPLFISFYTDAKYEVHARRLCDSLLMLGLEHFVIPVPDLGDWQANNKQKPRFILDRLWEYKRPVCWVDADATMERTPDLLASLDCDIAAHHLAWPGGRRELLGGTIYAAFTQKAVEALMDWDAMCKTDARTDQAVLDHFVQAGMNGAKFKDLPLEYCCIFDGVFGKAFDPKTVEPVILHHQASRDR